LVAVFGVESTGNYPLAVILRAGQGRLNSTFLSVRSPEYVGFEVRAQRLKSPRERTIFFAITPSLCFLDRGSKGGASPSLNPPDRQGAGAATRSASNAAHLTLRLRHSGGRAGFRRAQNTAPSGVSRPFLGAGEHSLRLFLQEVGLQGVRPLRKRLGNSARVEIFARSFQATLHIR